MRVYYNEWDKYAAQWLRNLIAAGLIPAGDVDERDIREIQPGDLVNYDQCHFFAGIAGWPLALDLAGWGARSVWTASCPCQPFSAAGKRAGTADARHLWPELLRLATAAKPPTVFGEQVASKDGRLWLAGVRADLEALGYEFGAADLCAASVGAPHIRQRLFWVAAADGGNAGAERQQRSGQQRQFAADCGASGMAHTERDTGRAGRTPSEPGESPGASNFWTSTEPGRRGHSIPCLDGKSRRIEPGTFPLAHGVSNRVGKLRAYGNAIVPALGAEFISAFMEAA